HAVVLSGGGAFAAFEIGILRALAHGTASSTKGEKIEFDILTGTSAGAFNAAVLASKPDLDAGEAVEYLESLWLGRLAGDIDSNPNCAGGVVINTPLKPAIAACADVIHAVALNPDLKDIPLRTVSATMDTFERFLDIVVAGHLKDDIASARLRNSLVGVIN